MGTITGIPQTAFEKALETSGIKLSELGDMIDQSAPGTLNTLLGRDIPVVGNLKLRDFLPFVGSKDDGKLTGTPAALIAAGTGQPLRGQPVVGSSIGPDGQRYYGTSGSPAMLSEDVGTAAIDVATLGLGRPLAAGAKKAVKATKSMPVGMSTKAVGQGVDELGFYSAAKQAVDAIQQPKGTGQQFLKQIEKTPGVKPDEIKWTGLDEFLQSKKSVTKAEVQEYLDKNRVEIKEVTLGSNSINDKSKYALPQVMDVIKQNEGDDFERIYLDLSNDQLAYEALTRKFPELKDDNDFAYTVLKDIIKGEMPSTKFSKYTLPGGENYREILLTLPTKMLDRDSPKMIKAATEAYGEKSLSRLSDSQWQLISNRLQSTPEFESQHFDQPNILAHIRVNDRVIDGKKTLFVEEVQSDWHQAGRKKGYKNPNTEKQILDLEKQMSDMAEIRDPVTNQIVDEEKFSALWRKKDELLEQNKGVPDAPFKTTWSDLSMKRVIQMASEGGYDRIAFTTGKTQAERYDLSKQINELSYKKMDDNLTMKLGDGPYYEVVAVDKNDMPVLRKQVTEQELPDLVGKEIAKKIVDGEGKVAEDYMGKSVTKVFSGLDLQVGGEGMKGFYDDILPKFLNKYAKKWDAKTGVTEIPTSNVNIENQITFEDGKYLVDAGDGINYNSYNTKAEAIKSLGGDNPQVNYIDVTPKMRESVVTKGQPMFAIGAGGAGAAATQEENK
jgi:hypothetical protein